jgi:hypothetical protein
MTFTHLSLILIIFLLIFPAKIKEPNNIKFYDEYGLRLRSTCVKIYIFFYILAIGFYILAFLMIFIYKIFI